MRDEDQLPSAAPRTRGIVHSIDKTGRYKICRSDFCPQRQTYMFGASKAGAVATAEHPAEPSISARERRARSEGRRLEDARRGGSVGLRTWRVGRADDSRAVLREVS